MSKSFSRMAVELAIILGIFSIAIGVIQKLINITTVYAPHILGLTPSDFLLFAAVCFLFALAATGRHILKYLELKRN